MERYRGDARYQAIIRQDLVPLWRRMVEAPGWREELPATSLSFTDVLDELAVLERQVPMPMAAPLAELYVAAVARTVGRSMGLIDEGRPASWALRGCLGRGVGG